MVDKLVHLVVKEAMHNLFKTLQKWVLTNFNSFGLTYFDPYYSLINCTLLMVALKSLQSLTVQNLTTAYHGHVVYEMWKIIG